MRKLALICVALAGCFYDLEHLREHDGGAGGGGAGSSGIAGSSGGAAGGLAGSVGSGGSAQAGASGSAGRGGSSAAGAGPGGQSGSAGAAGAAGTTTTGGTTGAAGTTATAGAGGRGGAAGSIGGTSGASGSSGGTGGTAGTTAGTGGTAGTTGGTGGTAGTGGTGGTAGTTAGTGGTAGTTGGTGGTAGTTAGAGGTAGTTAGTGGTGGATGGTAGGYSCPLGGVLDCSPTGAFSLAPDGQITDFSAAEWSSPAAKWCNAHGLDGSIFQYAGTGSTSTAFIDATMRNLALNFTVVAGQYAGGGVLFDSCVNASAFNALEFTAAVAAGSLSGCTLQVQLQTQDQRASTATNPSGGTCASNCYQFPARVLPELPATTSTITVLFTAFNNPAGSTIPARTQIVGLQWQANSGDSGVSTCSVELRIDDIRFVTY